MLGESDVQLVFRLLDSLTESLKKLTTNYEILVRNGDTQTRGISELCLKLSEFKTELDNIARSFQSYSDMMSASMSSVSACVEKISVLNKQMDQLIEGDKAGVKGVDHLESELKKDIAHADGHLDKSESIMTQMSTKIEDINKIAAGLDGLRKDLGPLNRLSSQVSRPLTVILVLYMFLATLIAFWNVADATSGKVKAFFKYMSDDQNTTIVTNSVVVTNFVNKATP